MLAKARLTRAAGATGAVTLIQRFGSALNFNVHLHMLVLDGAYFLQNKTVPSENFKCALCNGETKN